MDERRITFLESIEKGWGPDRGEPPTEAAMEMVRGFDRALAYLPLPDGGVQVEFHALGLDFEAVIGPEGAIEDYDCQPLSQTTENEWDALADKGA